jgi:hypothetical protein
MRCGSQPVRPCTDDNYWTLAHGWYDCIAVL